jgi:hypothetical protein
MGADLNGDSNVDMKDLLLFSENWLAAYEN